MRVNVADNLRHLNVRPRIRDPIRSDIYNFTKNPLNLENAYIGYTHSFTPALHASAAAGYLEEFYSGAGGEILYRPFASRWALGGELWRVKRRDPDTTLNLGLKHTGTTTAHVNGWYDLPRHDLTLHAKAGRFLAGDLGLSLGLDKIFKNGVKLNSAITVSNKNDVDLFGKTAHAEHKINLTLPLGHIPYIPTGSELRTSVRPFGRDTGQSVKSPLNLFEMTENFTLDHIATYWAKILE